MIELPEIVKKQLKNLGFNYNNLKENATTVNKYLTLLYDEIKLPNMSGQKCINKILLMIGIGYPQNDEKAIVDYIYATSVSIDKKTKKEEELLAKTFYSRDGSLPTKSQLPEKMKKLSREMEIAQKFNIENNNSLSYKTQVNGSFKVKRK